MQSKVYVIKQIVDATGTICIPTSSCSHCLLAEEYVWMDKAEYEQSQAEGMSLILIEDSSPSQPAPPKPVKSEKPVKPAASAPAKKSAKTKKYSLFTIEYLL